MKVIYRFTSRQAITKTVATVVAVVIAVAIIAGVYYYISSQPTEVLYFKIGYVAPFTGPAAEYGTNGWRGMQIALEEINGPEGIILSTEEKRRILGAPEGILVGGKIYKFEIIRYDDKCDPKESVAATQRLIVQDEVSVIIGSHCSSCCFAIQHFAEDYRIPMISPECMARDLTTGGNQWWFRYETPADIQAERIAEDIVKDFGVKSAAFLAINDDYGRSCVEGYTAQFERLGVTITSANYFERGTTDFTPFLAKIKSENPDILYFVGVMAEGTMIVRQAREIGLTEHTLLFGAGEYGSEEFGKLVGVEAIEGLIATVPMNKEMNMTLYNRMREEIQKRYNAPIHYANVRGWDCLWIIAQAIRYADSVDPEKINEMLNTRAFKTIVDDHLTFDDFDWHEFHFTNQGIIIPPLIWWHNGEINFDITKHPRYVGGD